MKKRITLLGILCLLCLNVFAQHPEFPDLAPNLVPNPGFEKVKKGIDLSKEGYLQFHHFMQDWSSPSNTTPDLIGVNPHRIKDVKENGLEVDIPRSGNRTVAIITDNPQVAESRTDTYREYIQAQLIEPLREGEDYHLEFYVKKAHEAKLVSNNIGAFFLPAAKYEDDYEPILLTPSVNYDKMINEDKAEWIKIEGEFTAKSNDSYIMIGNFFDTKSTTVKQIKPEGWNNSYYLVDDINLYQLTNLEAPAPEPEPEPEPEPVVEAEPEEETLDNIEVAVGKTIQLRNIYFETAKWGLLPASNAELEKLLALLNEYPTMTIAIHGHTDSRGGANYNQNLSENRAGAVREYLLDHGVDANRLSHEGFGLERPIATNDTSEGRQMNRRVEFVIVSM